MSAGQNLVFRYPTYYRVVFSIGSVFGIAMAVFAALGDEKHGGGFQWPAMMLLAFGALSAWALWLFSTTIVVTSLAVERRRLGRNVSIAWNTIRFVKVNSSSLTLIGNGVKIRVELQLGGYLEFYETVRKHAPAAAFDTLPQLPFTAQAGRFLLWLPVGCGALLPGLGAWFLIRGQNRGVSLFLFLLGLGLFILMLREMILRFEFSNEALRVVRIYRSEILPWDTLEFAQVVGSEQVSLHMSFRGGRRIVIASGGSNIPPERIFEGMQQIWQARTMAADGTPSAPAPMPSTTSPWYLAAVWFTVPLIGLVMFPLVSHHQRESWMDVVRKDFPAASESELAPRSLSALCSDPIQKARLGPLCTDQDRLGALTALSIATAAFILALALGVRVAGRRCRQDRRRLLTVFKPLLFVVGVAAVLILLLQTVLFLALLFYGMVEFLNRIPSGLIIVTAIGALIGVFGVARAMFMATRGAEISVDGSLVTAEAQPDLWKFVANTAASLGTEPPLNIVVGLDPTFFVTEARVNTSGGPCEGRTLYVSALLCRLLDPTELRGLLIHEMAHFLGGDTEFSAKFSPIYQGASQSLAGIQSGRMAVTVLPAAHMLCFFLDNFAEAESEVSRSRELVADRAAAGVVGGLACCSALAKLALHEPMWFGFVDEQPDLEEGTNWSRMFAHDEKKRLKTIEWHAWVESLTGEDIIHPMDSHPPLKERVRALGLELDSLPSERILSVPHDPASELIHGIEECERTLTVKLHESLAAVRPNSFVFLPGFRRSQTTPAH